MRIVRIGLEALLLGLVLWFSVASSEDDEGSDPPPADNSGNNPGTPGDPAKACSADTECPSFNAMDKCAAQERCVGGLCVWQEGVTCSQANGQSACKTAACDPASGTCALTPAGDGAFCDDGNACTNGDQCKSGSCIPGSSATCDDGNPCTSDSCNTTTGCSYVLKSEGTPCGNPNKCYGPSKCDVYGGCNAGEAVTCNDGNDCTQDSCNPDSGCTFVVSEGQLCDDADPCTAGDQCTAAGCQGTPMEEGLACEDGNPCTGGSTCTSGLCKGGVPVGDGGACEDADPCTEATTCQEGSCAGGSLVVCPDDGNPCTVELCQAEQGCTTEAAPPDTECPTDLPCYEKAMCEGWECIPTVQRKNGTLCEDGSPCTGASICQNGACTAGTPLGEGAVCDDGNACTSGEICSSQVCSGGQPITCDDGNVCTYDSCDGTLGCTTTAIDGECEDDDPCTVATSCQDGACVGLPLCDDGDPCTADSCDAQGACSSAYEAALCPVEASCDDGIDDDGDGLTDCAQPGCAKAYPVHCGGLKDLPALVTFDESPAPGFGAWQVDGASSVWAKDGTPASVTPWSGDATLNFNDGALASMPELAGTAFARAELCCWSDPGADLHLTWMEYVDLPGPPEVTNLQRSAAFVSDGGQVVEQQLPIGGAEAGMWVRRTITKPAGLALGQLSVRFSLGGAGGLWSGGAGWFVDDVELLASEDCTNEVDDNGNGDVDCDDVLCESFDGCMELYCDNTVDDDGDGATDCDDPDCAGATGCP